MNDKTTQLLRLRETLGEQAYRDKTLELLRATKIPDLGQPLDTGPRRRRVEGFIRLPHADPHGNDLTGLVMFAAGAGDGALADVRSKNGGHTSAWSLLKEHPEASFIIIVTTSEPITKVRDKALSYGTVFVKDGSWRPVIWILTIDEIVQRAEHFDAAALPGDGRPWWKRLLQRPIEAAPRAISPLLLSAETR